MLKIIKANINFNNLMNNYDKQPNFYLLVHAFAQHTIKPKRALMYHLIVDTNHNDN